EERDFTRAMARATSALSQSQLYVMLRVTALAVVGTGLLTEWTHTLGDETTRSRLAAVVAVVAATVGLGIIGFAAVYLGQIVHRCWGPGRRYVQGLRRKQPTTSIVTTNTWPVDSRFDDDRDARWVWWCETGGRFVVLVVAAIYGFWCWR